MARSIPATRYRPIWNEVNYERDSISQISISQIVRQRQSAASRSRPDHIAPDCAGKNLVFSDREVAIASEVPQDFVANQMTWRAPLRVAVARTATSFTAKPAARSRLENAGLGPDDQTASTPPGRSALRIAFNPFRL